MSEIFLQSLYGDGVATTNTLLQVRDWTCLKILTMYGISEHIYYSHRSCHVTLDLSIGVDFGGQPGHVPPPK